MPCRSGQVWIATMKSVMNTLVECAQARMQVTFSDVTGNPMVGMARSLLVSDFLSNQLATDILFIDDDIVWQPGAVTRIMSHDVDMVAGIYPRRFDPPGYNVRLFDGRQPELTDKGLIEVEAVPAGFLRMSRLCIERMIEAYPESYFEAESDPNTTGYDLFHTGRDGKLYWGEDYEFCRKWRSIGGTVWADPMLTFLHAG